MLFPKSTETILQRTDITYHQDIAKAVKTNTIVSGIKGNTLLRDFIRFPDGLPIDSLPLLNEGVFKCLVALWFDSKNKDKDFYIG